MSFDVAIIGGGINGLGVARDLAKRGLKVYLAEARDFGMGASGNSSGMFHGGARYLLSDPQLVAQSCRDSGYVQAIAKNLMFRIPMIIPIDRSRTYLELMEVFFTAYDRYQPLKRGMPHGRLTRDEVLRVEPGLRSEGLLGAVTTDEWGIDVYRLCVLNALDARAHGAVIDNYARVTEVLREADRVVGVRVQGREIRAKHVLNCTGAWNARRNLGLNAKVRPGKGIHLVFNARISDFALVSFAIDGRQTFLMPHQNEMWMGTTDDDYFGDPEAIEVTQDEVEYCYQAAENVFPRIRDYRAFATSVGLRPTTFAWGPNEDDLSREHEIVDHGDGSLSMIGGKLASYRSMSQDLADRVSSHPCRTHMDALPGNNELVDAHELARRFKIEGIAARRLARRHGTQAAKILETGKHETVCACEPVLECEVRHVLRTEMVKQPTDLVRRCRVAAGPCLGLRCAKRAGEIFAEEKGGSAHDAGRQLIDHALSRAAPLRDERALAQRELVETQWQR